MAQDDRITGEAYFAYAQQSDLLHEFALVQSVFVFTLWGQLHGGQGEKIY